MKTSQYRTLLVFIVVVCSHVASVLGYLHSPSRDHLPFIATAKGSTIRIKSSLALSSPKFIDEKRLREYKRTIDTSKALYYEDQLLRILESGKISGRGKRSDSGTIETINQLIIELENVGKQINSIIQPIDNPSLDGCWKLLYTSTPGTNSPIQRTFTAIDQGVNVYQIVNVVQPNNNGYCYSYLSDNRGKESSEVLPEVSNTICFGDSTRLRITALASTENRPIIVPRQNDGKIFGLNVFGVSSTSAPRVSKERIDFAFQEARFEFKKTPNFGLPYPVPFKLLGDESKGWLDITYTSSKFRISRGNKGTIFLLKKVTDLSEDPIAQLATNDLKDPIRNSKQTPTEALTASTKDLGSVNSETKKQSIPSPFSIFSQVFSSQSKPNTKQKTKSKRSLILFPAQLGIDADYDDFVTAITEIDQSYTGRIFPVPLARLDWIVGLLPSFFRKDYFAGTLTPNPTLQFYFRKVDDAVRQAIDKDPNTELVLVGHSIGGWIARAWLSEWASEEIKSRVKIYVSLGSPHNPPPKGTTYEAIDQTRGLLTYINAKYPGAFEKDVSYSTVIGNGVQGKFNILDIQQLVAFGSYSVLSGDGNIDGDGIIPLDASTLEGAKQIILENVKHSNYLPLPGKSLKLPISWYGTKSALEKWLSSTNII